jgi:hypothetical protein
LIVNLIVVIAAVVATAITVLMMTMSLQRKGMLIMVITAMKIFLKKNRKKRSD